MITGARLIAPDGYLSLSRGVTYYLLKNDADNNRARLILFFDNGKELAASLITLSTIDFEEGLETGLIEESGEVEMYPPWLGPIEGLAIYDLERRRSSVKESYEVKVNRRFFAIAELVQCHHEILASENPDAIINAHAKQKKPQQNSSRLRLWFYTYIIFGRNKWALMPPLHRIGTWNRLAKNRKRKIGRTGKHQGYASNADMVKRIIAGYIAHRSPYKTKAEIYSEILTEEFGCVAVEIGETKKFIHPKGLPFPSESQIRYRIEKHFAERSRSIGVRGKNSTRAKSGDIGSFSERVQNVNQIVEFDGYYVSEKLTGVTEGSAVDGFCVVRAVCILSGAIVGIGFAEGKETLAAYRMCLFSMALRKDKFCELFGCPITKDEWPSEGVTGSIIFDRGPGSTLDVEAGINWLGTFETTPVFSGQSKASIESSHPRDKQILEQPSYFQSALNFVQMCKREIIQVLKDNSISNASGRMDERMYVAGVTPSPLGIWNYWSRRGRDSSVGMQFDTAVRTFLDKHPASIRQDAVYFYGRKYKSPGLVATGVFDRVAKASVIPAQVYVLTMCVRHIWIEVDGRLYELDMVKSIRTLEGDSDISLWDLQAVNKLQRESVNALLAQGVAAQSYYNVRVKEATGEDGGAGVRRAGRAPKNAAATRDTADYNKFMGKSK